MAQYFPWFQLDGFDERGDKSKESEQQGGEYRSEEGGVRREDEKKLKAPELNW